MRGPGFLAYMLTNYALNAVGHGNTEWLPKRFVTSWVGRVFFTPTFHAMHHARYQGHYGLYTVLLDRWFGTTFEDYPQVHARARDGEGLTRMGERLPAGPSPLPAPAAPEARPAL
ncbi:sterol desaturase family protein [Corallococcus soli]|uniref:sterol desaturase family protein n=1 Tax=Corallococcus soli TaxID=2710757 RepID=UPI001D03EDA2|nr:sterol desaturase family protein [Corallococcus soli]